MIYLLHREEIKANEEPFEKERALLSTLIVYCQKLDPGLSDGSDDGANLVNGKTSNGAASEVPKNCTIYRKNDEDDILFAGVKKNANKRSAKKQKVRQIPRLIFQSILVNLHFFQARHLKHNPETYMQFSSLALQPPTTSKDIPSLIEKLKSKKVRLIDFNLSAWKIEFEFSRHILRIWRKRKRRLEF